MTIYGIGTDIVQVEPRRRGDGAHQRPLRREGARPATNCASITRARRARRSAGLAFLATRFSAKEAFSKAIGLGMHWPMTWRALQPLNKPSGEPMVVASGELAEWLRGARHHRAGHDQRRARVRGVVCHRGKR